MKTEKVIKPMHEAIHSAGEMIQSAYTAGRDALDRRIHPRSHALDPMKKHAVLWVGASVSALALGWLAMRSFNRMMRAADEHRSWKTEDRKLDRAIEDTFDASDPIAKY